MENEDIPDSEKVRIASDFILHSPPGEFNEVFNDVRMLLNNDDLLRGGASGAFARYNKDQLTPARVESSASPATTLITEYNDIGGGRFCDPKTKQSFKYDHLRKEATDFRPWAPPPDLAALEGLRMAVEVEAAAYAANHFKHGTCAVFTTDLPEVGKAVVVCIEDHKFEAKNFWNGRWRSVWTICVSGNAAEVSGLMKVQVHYYELGNVQLVSSKDVKESVVVSSDESTAKEMVKILSDTESEYQKAILENYQTMSDTTFKALRRQLPVTRTKIDWNKIVSYAIGKELKTQ